MALDWAFPCGIVEVRLTNNPKITTLNLVTDAGGERMAKERKKG